jgi:hypothetical protein
MIVLCFVFLLHRPGHGPELRPPPCPIERNVTRFT